MSRYSSRFHSALYATAAVLTATIVSASTLAIAGGSASAPSGQAASAPVIVFTKGVAPATREQQASSLLQKAQSDGRVRVIVEVDIALQDEDTLSFAQEQNQSQALDSMQSAVASRGRIAASHVVKFGTIPFMSAFVTNAQLQRLLDDPQVVSIQEDGPVLRPLLDESTKLIRANTVWNREGYKGEGMTVAVLDTGAEYGHPMLRNSKIVAGFCRSTASATTNSLCPGGAASSNQKTSGRNCNSSIVGCDHGTHVSGIAVGKGGGLKGVAPEASLISGQVFSHVTADNDLTAYFSDVTAGLERVFQLRKKFNIASVNMSLGTADVYNSACDSRFPALAAIVNKLTRNKIAVVAASGNGYSNSGVSAPACIDKVVAVGSTTKLDAVSNFSNHHALVDLMAPGSSIRSSIPGGDFALFFGTSMAAPHVAGAWALMRQARPDASVKQVQNAFSTSGEDVTRNGLTKPRIDIFKGIKRLEGMMPLTETVEMQIQ